MWLYPAPLPGRLSHSEHIAGSKSSLTLSDSNRGDQGFVFMPCAKYLAIVGQDGLFRVLDYDSMDLVGSMKSYFGRLLCVC